MVREYGMLGFSNFTGSMFSPGDDDGHPRSLTDDRRLTSNRIELRRNYGVTDHPEIYGPVISYRA